MTQMWQIQKPSEQSTTAKVIKSRTDLDFYPPEAKCCRRSQPCPPYLWNPLEPQKQTTRQKPHQYKIATQGNRTRKKPKPTVRSELWNAAEPPLPLIIWHGSSFYFHPDLLVDFFSCYLKWQHCWSVREAQPFHKGR